MCVRFLEKKSITEVYNVIIVMTMRLFDTRKFWKKSVTDVYGSMLLALREKLGVSYFQGRSVT